MVGLEELSMELLTMMLACGKSSAAKREVGCDGDKVVMIAGDRSCCPLGEK